MAVKVGIVCYWDIETEEHVSFAQLENEWLANGRESGAGDPCTLDEYINACQTRNNGTLEPVYGYINE